MDETIEMSFGKWTLVGPRKRVFNWEPESPVGQGVVIRVNGHPGHAHACPHSIYVTYSTLFARGYQRCGLSLPSLQPHVFNQSINQDFNSR